MIKRVLKATSLPAGSRLKSYKAVLLCDLQFSIEVIRYGVNAD